MMLFAYGSRLALLLSLVTIVTTAGCSGGGDSGTPTSPTNATWIANVPFGTTDLQDGTGDEVTTGTRVTTDYAGWLYSTATSDNKGTLFDTSVRTGGAPLTFVVGSGTLIRGYEQGVVGMRVGGVRRVVIPPDLAYGSTGGGGGVIPPNATLIFEIRVNSIG